MFVRSQSETRSAGLCPASAVISLLFGAGRSPARGPQAAYSQLGVGALRAARSSRSTSARHPRCVGKDQAEAAGPTDEDFGTTELRMPVPSRVRVRRSVDGAWKHGADH